jgi:hypothetical protein
MLVGLVEELDEGLGAATAVFGLVLADSAAQTLFTFGLHADPHASSGYPNIERTQVSVFLAEVGTHGDVLRVPGHSPGGSIVNVPGKNEYRGARMLPDCCLEVFRHFGITLVRCAGFAFIGIVKDDLDPQTGSPPTSNVCDCGGHRLAVATIGHPAGEVRAFQETCVRTVALVSVKIGPYRIRVVRGDLECDQGTGGLVSHCSVTRELRQHLRRLFGPVHLPEQRERPRLHERLASANERWTRRSLLVGGLIRTRFQRSVRLARRTRDGRRRTPRSTGNGR